MANSSMLNCTELSSVDPDSINFHLFSEDDVRKLSVTKITSTESFDLMGNATPGGLYDIAMGPSKERFETCGTCFSTQLHCPGHFGHIELPVPVINPLFFRKIYTLFRMSCLRCYRIQISEQQMKILTLQLKLIDSGMVTEALDLGTYLTKLKSDVDSIKIAKQYKKLLKKIDPVLKTFQNKNVSALRNRILNNYMTSVNSNRLCMFCKQKLIKVTTSNNKIMYNAAVDGSGKGIKILTPDEIKQYCTKICEMDKAFLLHYIPALTNVKSVSISDAFFMELVPVTPPIVRPCNILKGEIVEHLQSKVYKTILNNALAMRTLMVIINSDDEQKAFDKLDSKNRYLYTSAQGKTVIEKLHNTWHELQMSVDCLLDSSKSKTNIGLGIKQIMERKQGIIRMHMMGKRVNFAARSVITPDPNVDIDEIGIPLVFAMKLTYPVPVTQFNIEQLRAMVINGPNKHPGAEKIEVANGRMIRIPTDCEKKRQALAKKLLTPDEFTSSKLKIVHRHLLDGDLMILNRQPSLHKPSMMAHRAKILKGEKTLRLHYANCKSYNADFDGDEMNAHFPQNELARSEAVHIMTVRKQYLVPKDGTPLSGLIQDHVISGVKMSLRGTFFNRADYHQLVFQALVKHKGEIKLLPPAILKPVMLWSGKQVLSTIIINNIPKGKPYLSLSSSAKISAKAWQKVPARPWKAGGTPLSELNMSEAEVIIRKGELLNGVLDKTHYGATPYGLVHCMYELYGGDSSSALLSSLSKVFTYHLQWIGFTLGVKDILVIDESNQQRDNIITLVRKVGKVAAAKATELPLDVSDTDMKAAVEEMMIKDPKFRANLDHQYKSVLDTYTNKINKVCLGEGLIESFPANNLQLMVQSGAKGSTVNTMQISCLLGQIELEGKRPPHMISGKTLPSFLEYDLSPRAGGFIDGRFMTGIQPQEFFFHCMAGREGLIDTAVKTSRSGYLQRCLIKHLEGLTVNYDYTVRDSDKSVIQFAYGEDGLDVLKSQFLKEKPFEFLDINSNAVTTKSTIKMLKEDNLKDVHKAQKAVKKWKKKNGDPFEKKLHPFTVFSRLSKEGIDITDVNDNTRDPFYWELSEKWRSLDDEEQAGYRSCKPCPDPVQSKLSPQFKFGVINEKIESLISSYLSKRKETVYSEYTEKDKFIDVMNVKYLESLADPGEPVGLLAAQSIGEPSTQMTLNTFHFAGRGDMNVTLGIPRLREILMTASANLKTPNMDIPFRENIQNLNKKAEKLRKVLTRVTVADVLEKIDVNCEVKVHPSRHLNTTMRFKFLPKKQYKSRFIVNPEQIIKHMQEKFFTEMFVFIRKQTKATGNIVWSDDKKSSRKKVKKGGDENDDDDEDIEGDQEDTTAVNIDADSSDDEVVNDDDDNTDAKMKKKRSEEQEYEDPESEEEEKSDEEEDAETATEAAEDTPEDMTQDEENIQVVNSVRNATNYTYDTKSHSWCEITIKFPINFLKVDITQILRDTASNSVIHEIKQIKRAITIKDKNTLTLKTEGINIIQMFKYNDVLDLNKLYSNDVHAIARTYGIEAALKIIIKEIQNVFNVYGIGVDSRHLSLIADYMTFNGVFEPMSRRGMEASTSPLQQMSFESSLTFLKEAVFNAKTDDINSASSCLMIGQPCRSGTGMFSVRPIDKVAQIN